MSFERVVFNWPLAVRSPCVRPDARIEGRGDVDREGKVVRCPAAIRNCAVSPPSLFFTIVRDRSSAQPRVDTLVYGLVRNEK
jgi:hypothetical protein